jgi:hypothetical protein
MDHRRYPSVHQGRSIQSTAATTTATTTIPETETEIGIVTEKQCLTTWEPAAALALATVVAPPKTQRTHESESASATPAERAVTTESKMNGTMGTSTQTGMKEATTTVRETTVEKETATETEIETGGRTGMFKEACKMASLAGGIQSFNGTY